MSSIVALTMVACMCMDTAVIGQRTDNCTSKAYKGFIPCGSGKCCCRSKIVICSGFGHELTYIPHLRQAMTKFRFDDNWLHYLSKESFTNISTKHIAYLTLANNGIMNIAENAFADFGRVKQVTLDGNKLTKVSARPFQSLKYLDTLYFNNNKIRYIENDAVQENVGYIGLTNNLLVDEMLPVWFCSADGKAIFPGLKHINLAGNYIKKLTNDSFKCLRQLQWLGLSKNVVETVDQNTFAYLSSLENIAFSNMRQTLKKISNYAFNNSKLEHLSLREDYITIRRNLSKTIFQHSTNIRILDISLNNLKLSPRQFLGMLRPLSKLEILSAEHCRIHELSANFLSFFRNLTKLNLKGNSIVSLEYFSDVYNLKYLLLNGNNINYIKKEELSDNFMNSLEKLDLSDNPFQCTCTLLWFRSMIKDDEGKFGNISLVLWPIRYMCKSPKKAPTPLIYYKPTKASCANVLEIIIVSMGVVLVTATIVSILSYRYRWYIKYWFYKLKTHRKNPETRPLLDPEHQAYDCYVIYHTEDMQFVHYDLRLFMEEKQGYKLHIWERNAPGSGAKLEGMVDGIHASEHVIAVISRNSIQDGWIKFQMDVALDRQVQLKRDFLVLVILEDIDFKALSKYWCIMLTRLNAARWCQDETDMKRAVFEHQLPNYIGNPANSRV